MAVPDRWVVFWCKVPILGKGWGLGVAPECEVINKATVVLVRSRTVQDRKVKGRLRSGDNRGSYTA